jgi:hypothetical protein
MGIFLKKEAFQTEISLKDLYDLIDQLPRLEREQLIMHYDQFDENTFDFENEVSGWQTLTPSQQNSLKLSIAESFDSTRLVAHETVLKMMDTWVNE